MALLGILTALSAVLRALPGPAGFNAIFLLPILAGYCYGPTFGFLLGALSLLVSALIGGGVGPWLPYQMLATGWVGLLSGWLPELHGHRRLEPVMLAVWGGVAGVDLRRDHEHLVLAVPGRRRVRPIRRQAACGSRG